MNFEMILEGMGNLSALGNYDTAIKFWLPEPAERAMEEYAKLQGESLSAMLREFFAVHCYGVYIVEILRGKDTGIFKDPAPVRYSKSREKRGKIRKTTYWVPELGKNVAPIKLWVSSRLRSDLQSLADHVGIPLSQYLREIVISRLLGHGMIPKRPEMLLATPLPSADDWCEGKDTPWIEVDGETYRKFPDGKIETEWEDD